MKREKIHGSETKTTRRDVAKFLARLPFGSSRSDEEECGARGIQDWLATQAKPTEEEYEEYREMRKNTSFVVKYKKKNEENEIEKTFTLDLIDRSIDESWKSISEDAPQQERFARRTVVSFSSLIGATSSKWRLREIMTEFFHDHFNVDATADSSIAVSLPAYDTVIRRHALGNFREMLEDVATSAAMLIYLNNRSSRNGAANENYARELFELHTMGRQAYLNASHARWSDVPGAKTGRPDGYIDQDVYEASRALTGWMVEDGSALPGGKALSKTGRFAYVEAFHDNYQKRILATEFEPYAKAMEDGRRLLDLVARHPATARFVSGKICKRLVADAPHKELLLAAENAWNANAREKDQIAKVVLAILRHPKFMEHEGDKIRRPVDLAVTFSRAAGIRLKPTLGLLGALDSTGQRMFGCLPPTGFPDDARSWIGTGTLKKRWELSMGLAINAWKNGKPDATAIDALATAENAIVEAAGRLCVDGIARDDPLVSAIASGLGLKLGDPFGKRKDAADLFGRALGLCSSLPRFQCR